MCSPISRITTHSPSLSKNPKRGSACLKNWRSYRTSHSKCPSMNSCPPAPSSTTTTTRANPTSPSKSGPTTFRIASTSATTASRKCSPKRKSPSCPTTPTLPTHVISRPLPTRHPRAWKFRPRARRISWTTCSKKIKADPIICYCLPLSTPIIIINNHGPMLATLSAPMVRLIAPFCTLGTRRYVLHPMYISPSYDQLQYSPYYFNQAKKLRMVTPNAHQVSEDRLPQFLIQQIQNDKMNFVKTKQFIFIGRSNSGKSSLINSIFKDKKIARVSRAPGTTRFLHFHEAAYGGEKLLITDAPGYGFARINKAKRSMWAGLIDEYLKISSRLCQIFICINFEHGVKSSDIEALKHISKYNLNIQLVLNKADKVKQKLFLAQLKSINEAIRRLQLPNINDRIIVCSNKTRFGIDVLRCRVVECLQKTKPRNIDNNQDLLLEYLKNMRVQPKDSGLAQRTLTKPHVVRKLIYNSKLTKFLV